MCTKKRLSTATCDSIGALSEIHDPVTENLRSHIVVILHHVQECDKTDDTVTKPFRGLTLKNAIQ
jgi:phage host-nuclease inhibitor protein Gam